MNPLEIPDPLIARYLSSEGLLEAASSLLSEGALYQDYCLRVELALLEVLADEGCFDAALLPAAHEAAARVELAEIRAEEERVRHDLKALVNVFSRHCPEPVRPYIHLGATSYDILSNAHLLRLREGVAQLVRPQLMRVARELARLAGEYAETAQIGRTHGQYAEPMTFGYAMAVYLDRLGGCMQALDESLTRLRGKFSGAVGAYTTPGLLYADPVAIEARILARVGLQGALTSTQITHPEPALTVLHHLTAAFGVLANLADDLRHLQRSEINEVAERYHSATQVGSSAMPHKRNPITWENVKSLWKTFMPSIMTYYLDQVSEHQRDLSNSASARFLPRLLLGLAVAASRAARGLETLVVDQSSMSERLASLHEVMSGPLQALLSKLGLEDAHEHVRLATVTARAENRKLLDVLSENSLAAPYVQRLTPAQREALASPAALTEPAARAARRCVAQWSAFLA